MLGKSELEIGRRLPAENCALEEAQGYTRWLATNHYENFRVVSWLLPSPLRQHFYNVYAYCRFSDDLGDELPDSGRAGALLSAWEDELQRAYQGAASHPVLIALRETTRQFDIPIDPFRDLLVAFKQDQTVHRYPTWESVLEYCRYSANPVGRLVLYLLGYRDPDRQGLSDATCTALQLANFWQDVARDLEKERIYIPLDLLATHGLCEADLVAKRFDGRYLALMKDLIERTRKLFREGAPLAGRVSARVRVDLELFNRGGCAVLDAIEAIGYDTLHRRPSVGRGVQARLMCRALASRLLAAFRPSADDSQKSEGASFAGRHA